MRAVDIIIKKREHQELTKEEINFLCGRDSPMAVFPIIRLLPGRWLCC